MTNQLKKLIENLYETFEDYPVPSAMEGCPCCVSQNDRESIHTKHLWDLQEEDLSKYTFKAITTWGNTNDFKYYLPRIFELLATTNFIVDTSTVLGKLQLGKWKYWSEAEKSVIKEFLLAWWSNVVRHKPFFDKEIFTEIYQLTNNVEELLDLWTISLSDNSFSNFLHLIYDNYSDIINKHQEFECFDDASITKFKVWIMENSKFLETGFFYFAGTDEELADKIATTQYFYKKLTP